MKATVRVLQLISKLYNLKIIMTQTCESIFNNLMHFKIVTFLNLKFNVKKNIQRWFTLNVQIYQLPKKGWTFTLFTLAFWKLYNRWTLNLEHEFVKHKRKNHLIFWDLKKNQTFKPQFKQMTDYEFRIQINHTFLKWKFWSKTFIRGIALYLSASKVAIRKMLFIV